MKYLLIIFFLVSLTSSAMADNKLSNAIGKYAWDKRQLIVFTPNINHKEYLNFQRILIAFKDELDERNLHSWHVIANDKVLLNTTIRNDVTALDFRDFYEVNDNEFILLLIGYDQGEKLRQNKINIDYILSEIDQMPMRLQELQSN